MTARARWYAALTAVLGGLAAGLAHPPFGLLPGLLGYALILRRIETEGPRPVRGAFSAGWLAGLGYFGISTWWIAEPFLVDVRVHGWMSPFAVVMMAGGLALFWGAAGALYRWIRPQSAWRVLVFAGVFAALEWLRGHILTGFPWNLPGETWRAGSAPSQSAALVGAYGLTWITLAIAAAPAVVLLPVRRLAQAGAVVAAGVALVGLYAIGGGRLAAAPPVSHPDQPIVRVVQANIDQKDKWRPENLDLIFSTYERLTRQPAARAPDIVIWPEGALPAVIDDLVAPGSPYAVRLRDVVGPGQTLLMGANRAEATARPGEYRYYNTLIAFGREADVLRVVGVYDKHHLVPFGEYLPLGDLAGTLGIRSLVHMPDDFSAGPKPKPIHAPGVPPVQPLICYEALFPSLAATTPRPQWILNVSNDAWFGRTSGPWQHLNIASYRAIEQGLPIVRATPTGVSAVIDGYGRVLPRARLGLGEEGVIDAPLPRALPPTIYSRFGDLPFTGMLIASALAWLAGRRRHADASPPERLVGT